MFLFQHLTSSNRGYLVKKLKYEFELPAKGFLNLKIECEIDKWVWGAYKWGGRVLIPR